MEALSHPKRNRPSIQYMFKCLVPALYAGGLVLFGSTSWASSYGPIDVIDPVKKSELWINRGFYSYHFDQNRNFNSVNYGFGAEYRFSSVASLTAGSYRNSYYHASSYIGAYWQPIAVGPVNISVVTGAFNGYANTNNGGWFPAVLPALTIEGNLLGINLIYIPTIPNHVSGSLSIQLKLKILN